MNEAGYNSINNWLSLLDSDPQLAYWMLEDWQVRFEEMLYETLYINHNT